MSSEAPELKPCPCGKIPERLSIMDGSTYRWRYVGCPCDEWWIEASVRYADRNDADAIYALCVDAWNRAPRLASSVDALLAARDAEIARLKLEVDLYRDRSDRLTGSLAAAKAKLSAERQRARLPVELVASINESLSAYVGVSVMRVLLREILEWHDASVEQPGQNQQERDSDG